MLLGANSKSRPLHVGNVVQSLHLPLVHSMCTRRRIDQVRTNLVSGSFLSTRAPSHLFTGDAIVWELNNPFLGTLPPQNKISAFLPKRTLTEHVRNIRRLL
ncbi:hypothetical protein TNCV_3791151 [Trichonephila clavipes]|nr:hypothetical protein TNCV_3791151 [Trichonephila clavipes]